VLLFVLVACFLFLLASLGPVRMTSTKGRNMELVFHFRPEAEITVKIIKNVELPAISVKGLTHRTIEQRMGNKRFN